MAMSNPSDYGGESCAPRPISATVQNYLRKSVSVSDITGRLVHGWIFALIGTLIGAALGAYVVWSTPASYSVQVTLMPLEAGSADISGGGGASGLEIISSLLGSNGAVPKFTRFIASLYTTKLAQEMDEKYDTLCDAFHCDKKTRKYPKGVGFYADVKRTIAKIEHVPDPDAPPTYLDLATYIHNTVTITSDKNTKLLVFDIETYDPKKASEFLVHLVAAANDRIKNEDNEVVKKSIEYVQQQLKTNTDLSQRDALTSMLAQKEQHLMLTNIDLPYVARIQDGPNVQAYNPSI